MRRELRHARPLHAWMKRWRVSPLGPLLLVALALCIAVLTDMNLSYQENSEFQPEKSALEEEVEHEWSSSKAVSPNKVNAAWFTSTEPTSLHETARAQLRDAQAAGHELIFADFIDLQGQVWAMAIKEDNGRCVCTLVSSDSEDTCRVAKFVIDEAVALELCGENSSSE